MIGGSRGGGGRRKDSSLTLRIFAKKTKRHKLGSEPDPPQRTLHAWPRALCALRLALSLSTPPRPCLLLTRVTVGGAVTSSYEGGIAAAACRCSSNTNSPRRPENNSRPKRHPVQTMSTAPWRVNVPYLFSLVSEIGIDSPSERRPVRRGLPRRRSGAVALPLGGGSAGNRSNCAKVDRIARAIAPSIKRIGGSLALLSARVPGRAGCMDCTRSALSCHPFAHHRCECVCGRRLAGPRTRLSCGMRLLLLFERCACGGERAAASQCE